MSTPARRRLMRDFKRWVSFLPNDHLELHYIFMFLLFVYYCAVYKI